MAAKKKVRAARGDGDPIDQKDMDRIVSELRASSDAAFQCVSMMARSVTPEHAKTLSNAISECFAHAGAALARYDAVMMKHDGTLPQRLRLERRMALALDLMNIDPFALEAKSSERAEEAAYEKIKARARRGR